MRVDATHRTWGYPATNWGQTVEKSGSRWGQFGLWMYRSTPTDEHPQLAHTTIPSRPCRSTSPNKRCPQHPQHLRLLLNFSFSRKQQNKRRGGGQTREATAQARQHQAVESQDPDDDGANNALRWGLSALISTSGLRRGRPGMCSTGEHCAGKHCRLSSATIAPAHAAA